MGNWSEREMSICALLDPQNPDVQFVADAIVANPPAYGGWRAGGMFLS